MERHSLVSLGLKRIGTGSERIVMSLVSLGWKRIGMERDGLDWTGVDGNAVISIGLE